MDIEIEGDARRRFHNLEWNETPRSSRGRGGRSVAARQRTATPRPPTDPRLRRGRRPAVGVHTPPDIIADAEPVNVEPVDVENPPVRGNNGFCVILHNNKQKFVRFLILFF